MELEKVKKDLEEAVKCQQMRKTEKIEFIYGFFTLSYSYQTVNSVIYSRAADRKKRNSQGGSLLGNGRGAAAAQATNRKKRTTTCTRPSTTPPLTIKINYMSTKEDR